MRKILMLIMVLMLALPAFAYNIGDVAEGMWFRVNNSILMNPDDNPEYDAIMKAVAAYYMAEIKRDYDLMWELIAPSSDYKKRITYEQYKERVKKIEWGVVRFKVFKVRQTSGSCL